jgi:hypothetical protein
MPDKNFDVASAAAGSVPPLGPLLYAAVASIPLATYGARKMLGGYEKQASVRGALAELRRLVRSPLSSEGLFGKEVMMKAKRGPVLWHGPRFNEESGFHTGPNDVDFLGWMFGNKRKAVADVIDPKAPAGQNILTRLYSRLGGMGVIDSTNLRHGRFSSPAVVLDIDGSARETLAGKGVWDAANMGRKRVNVEKKLAELYPDATRIHVEPSTFRGDKLREAAAIPGINKTKTLAQIFPKGIPNSPERARAQLEKVFGPNWIVKAREGLASADSNLTDQALGKELLARLRYAISNEGGANRVIAQRRSDAKEVGPLRKMLDNFASDSGIGMKKKEYRVHVVNGKVVPYATYGRGNTYDYINTVLNPFRTKEVRKVEEAAQHAIDNAPNLVNRTKASYGFDVGVDKSGRPFIVETNPSEGSIASSWFSSPFVADAVTSATRGKLPAWVKARNSLYGAGLAGVGGYGLSKQGAEDTGASVGGAAGRIGLAALSADTVYNAVQLARHANEMGSVHDAGIKAFRRGGLGMGDKALLLQRYADLAGQALNRRVLGLPVHLLLRATTPSADVSIGDRLRHATGRSTSGATGKSITDAREHYKGFAKSPRLAMLREIMADDPTATKLKTTPRTTAARAVQTAMAGETQGPDIRALFGGDSYKDKTLSKGINNRFSEFFLGGQKTVKRFSPSQARSWGLTPYARAIRPAAGILGLLGAAGLGGAALS